MYLILRTRANGYVVVPPFVLKKKKEKKKNGCYLFDVERINFASPWRNADLEDFDRWHSKITCVGFMSRINYNTLPECEITVSKSRDHNPGVARSCYVHGDFFFFFVKEFALSFYELLFLMR